jgi:hypothetical protein
MLPKCEPVAQGTEQRKDIVPRSRDR